jgi:hypothetical protein
MEVAKQIKKRVQIFIRGGMQKFTSRLVYFFIIAIAVSLTSSVKAVEVSAGVGSGVNVRVQTGLHNNTGQIANDLHVTIFQKEKGVSVNGGTVNVGGFPNGNANLVGGFGHTDGKMHGIEAKFSGAEIEHCTTIPLDANLCLSKENQLWLDYQWTYNNANIGGGKPGGMKVGRPGAGGGGGNLGQQDGMGGSGNYIHPFSYFNEKEDEGLLLNSVYLYASMDYIEDISTIDWDNIPAVLSTPILIAPSSSFDYNFETTGDYIGGHIYIRVFVVDDPMVIYFDHPVPEPASIILMAIGGLTVVLRRKY